MGARKRDWPAILLVAPATAVFLALLVLPMIVVLVMSLGDRAEAGGYQAVSSTQRSDHSDPSSGVRVSE